MAKTLKFRRGNTEVSTAFTGANGEIFINTDNKTISVHDGSTVGGVVVGSNASLITSGSLNTSRLPATANVTTAINVGANVNLTTSGINVGNSTVNSTINSTSMNVGANVNLTTSRINVGNSTVNAFITSTSMEIDGTINSGNLTVTGIASVSRDANAVGAGASVTVAAFSNVNSSFGSSDFQNPASAQAVRGRILGSNLTGTYNYTAGVVGQYLITGTNASNFPKVGIMGVIGNQTTSADAAVMAYLDGDGGLTTANAAFGVSMKNSTGGSGFNYGLDLKYLDIGNTSVVANSYNTADIRLQNGLLIKSETIAITSGDATSTPAGTLVLTSNNTGVGSVFVSNGSVLKQLAFVS